MHIFDFCANINNKYYYYVIIECQHFYIITTVNVELNISNNKLTKNESQACTDIMCTDILTGKMNDGYSIKDIWQDVNCFKILENN